MKKHSSPFRSERGSLLLVAMLLCAIIGISIASYIRLGVQSQKISNRALYNNGAMNIAEQGLEEAMYSVNKMVNDSTYDWTTNSWTMTNGGADARRKITGYTFDQNATGYVRVYVMHADGNFAPTLLARSTVTLGGASAAPIEKWIKVVLAMTSKFANGLVAKQSISFSGNNASVDSWNSDPDNNSATTAVKYSSTTKNDDGSVGSISVSVSAVNVQNADIWGYVATGGSPATVGSNGLVGPWGTTSGTIASGHSSTDFAASFDNVTAPSKTYTPIGTINSNGTVHLPGSVAADADGKYYIDCSGITKGVVEVDPGKEVIIRMSGGISLQGGTEGINLDAGAKLAIYTSSDVDLSGQGVMNAGTTTSTAGQPVNFQIWGTATSGTQNIKIAGNGILSGIIYAPYGSVKINGNGDVQGSVVANDITVVGNAAFHYDESLGNFGGNPFRVASWSELTTAADRNSYSSYLSF